MTFTLKIQTDISINPIHLPIKNFLIKKKACSKKDKSMPFVATYHPILQVLDDIIKRHLIWLYTDCCYFDLDTCFHFEKLGK